MTANEMTNEQKEEAHRLALAADGKCEAIVWVAVNESGEFAASDDRDDAGERLDDNSGGLQRQLYKLVLVLPCPKIIESKGVMPESASGEYTIEVKQPE
jgi:hypothetical protein